MRATSVYPRGCRNLQIGFGGPDRSRNRELGQSMLRLDHIHLIDDQPKPVSHIDHRSIHRLSGGSGKYEADRFGFAADRERVNFSRWFFVCDRRAHLEHVSPQYLSTPLQVIGVILHKGSSTFETVAHDLHRSHQSCGFPVALRAKAVAGFHQTLNSDSGELCQPVQIFKRIGEGMRISFLEKMPQANLNSGSLEQRMTLATPLAERLRR